jgi:hypothetical protein
LKKHPVNKSLTFYNEFVSLTFKATDFKKEVDMDYYKKLASVAKKMGL